MASLRKRGAFWYIRYRTAQGKTTEVKASRDKQTAKSMAADLEDKQQKIKLGQLDPREAAWIDAEQVHIATHVQDYIRNLEASGRVPEHFSAVQKRLEWFLDESKITRLSQLNPFVVTVALKPLRDAGKSDRTVFHYVSCIKAFSHWLKENRRTNGDLLEDLKRPAVVTETERTPLTPEQMERLIATTRVSKPRRKLSGVDRSWCYHLAVLTGFRRSELQSLTPEAFNLDADPPTVFVAGAHTKNGKDAIQPLPVYIIDDLRSWLAGKPAYATLFPPDRNSSLMIKADLKAAGIPSDRFTFHSLRHTYTTLVDGCGASHKQTMTLARHSNANLTFNTYAHTQLQDLGRVVNNLPDLRQNGGQANAYASFAHTLPTPVVSGGLSGSLQSQLKQRPGENQVDPSRHVFQSG